MLRAYPKQYRHLKCKPRSRSPQPADWFLKYMMGLAHVGSKPSNYRLEVLSILKGGEGQERQSRKEVFHHSAVQFLWALQECLPLSWLLLL